MAQKHFGESRPHSSSCLPNRVILVPPELPVARAPLVFRECLANVVQVVFKVPRVTEVMLVPKVLMVLLAKMAPVV